MTFKGAIQSDLVVGRYESRMNALAVDVPFRGPLERTIRFIWMKPRSLARRLSAWVSGSLFAQKKK